MRLIQWGKNAVVKILSFDPKSNTVRYRDEDVRAIGAASIDNFVISEDFSPTEPNQQQ